MNGDPWQRTVDNCRLGPTFVGGQILFQSYLGRGASLGGGLNQANQITGAVVVRNDGDIFLGVAGAVSGRLFSGVWDP